jgi:hypothetical protein
MSINEAWMDALKHEAERGTRPERLIDDILVAVRDDQYEWLLDYTTRHGLDEAERHCLEWLSGTSQSLSRSTSVVANLVEDVHREVYTRYLSGLRLPHGGPLPHSVAERLYDIKQAA